ncbi:uncharacterized protein [Lepeophtheirus salmonis]|uniref:BTB domain-containing protein n=1 Tax=Lepeophtheirus salmonis TaxID=72036 RepID=A0A0K2TWU6_LEPSM|nr:protein tramtrack, beta isoform-like [Lepeophtheirus salmonis]
MMSVQALRTQQYCLKWNNHNKNVSKVFDRLRVSEQFVDVTLSTADKKSIKCHKIILSAGSGYLEEILEENPSDHPTIVLSQIVFEDLKLLIDFMYAGEVSVEQARLVRLLDAAKILKIKGLYETAPFEEDGMSPSHEIATTTESATHSPLKTTPNNTIVVETQKRKRNESSTDSKESTNPSSPKSLTSNPLFGVTNAYFLTNANMNHTSPKPIQPVGSVPMLISKNDLSHTNESSSLPIKPMSPSDESNKLSKINQILTNGQIRRYKQYTEETLQQALKEIMEGQSINRSSTKYNIPARTLRDWMKRLNIKSVFTHNMNNSNSSLKNDVDHKSLSEEELREISTHPDLTSNEDLKREPQEDEEMEEEIDDDEEEKLKIDEEM